MLPSVVREQLSNLGRICFRSAILLAITSSVWVHGSEVDSGGVAPPAQPESATARQYAPSPEINLIHLALDVTPDFRLRTISAEAKLTFRPIAKPLQELRLDAIDLTVTNVTATEPVQAWQVTTDKVVITFARPLAPDRETTVTLRYRAQPTQGIYFRTREMGYPAQDEHLWTQGESTEARHWIPCYDAPNEKFTSEITCRVPEGMVVLSNGRKVSEEKSGGLVAVRWLQDKPHVSYLISLVAGHFKKIEDRHRDIPLAFWTVPSDFNEAPNSFAGTRDMLDFFEKETGVPYPWAKYDQVCVLDFLHGGMENTSISTLTANTLFPKECAGTRHSQGLVAHELAHQWFGDLVTCKDWSHLWLNEGFATYYEHLYDGHKNGRDMLLYRVWLAFRSLTANPNDTRPIVTRRFDNPGQQFNHLSYGKGACVLHMLRTELGPELYRRCVRTFLERHAYGCVVTEDFNRVLEELAGRSFDRFFDQWVYQGGTPVLDVDYSWDEPAKQARLTIRQTPPAGDASFVFQFPLKLRFKTKATAVDRVVTIRSKSEDFTFPFPQAPDVVRIDPELGVLARVNFRPSKPMLEAQAADKSDGLGRLLAIEQFESRKDHESIARLKDLLNQDSFYAVRIEASKALRAIHSDETFEALLASTEQTDARVRRQVISDIGSFHRDAALTELLRIVEKEKNPDIVAEAIAGLASYARPEVRPVLLKQLRSTSYRNVLADAAIRSMRAQADTAYVEPLLETLEKRAGAFTTSGMSAGLEALAALAKTLSDKAAIREFLSRQTSHSRQAIQVTAISALGTLEDVRALPLLETFARASKESRERKAAERAIETIRAAKKPAVELGDLRKELQELQKDNRELKKEIEALKKRNDTPLPGKPGKKS